MADDVATSAVGNEEVAQISDRATTTAEETQKDEQGTQGETPLATAPAPGGGEEIRKQEPPDNGARTGETGMVATALAQDAQATAMAHGTLTMRTESVAVDAQEVPAPTKKEVSSMLHGTPQDATQARERKACEKLVNMRAEKIRIIKGN